MDQLTVESFANHLHETFDVAAGESTLPLVLVEARARDLPRAGFRTPFTLLFHGPATPVLPQAIYRFHHDAMGDLDLFIVPVGPDGTAMRYEAVFG